MNYKGQNVRIEQDNNKNTRVFIDGKELMGVLEVSYRSGVNEIPIITVEFMPATLNKEEKTELKAQITVDGNKIADAVVKQINEQMRRGMKEGVIL